MSDNKMVREKIELSNKEVSEIMQAIELISGLNLPMATSFDLGVLRRELKNANEACDDETKKLFREFAKKREDKDKKEEYFVPLSSQEDYFAKLKALDERKDTYSLPTFTLAQFTADKDDKDDDRKKIPNGFITRMMPVLKQ